MGRRGDRRNEPGSARAPQRVTARSGGLAAERSLFARLPDGLGRPMRSKRPSSRRSATRSPRPWERHRERANESRTLRRCPAARHLPSRRTGRPAMPSPNTPRSTGRRRPPWSGGCPAAAASAAPGQARRARHAPGTSTDDDRTASGECSARGRWLERHASRPGGSRIALRCPTGLGRDTLAARGPIARVPGGAP